MAISQPLINLVISQMADIAKEAEKVETNIIPYIVNPQSKAISTTGIWVNFIFEQLFLKLISNYQQ